MEMLRDDPLDSIYDPEDDATEGKSTKVIQRAVMFSKFGAIEYIEYEKDEGVELRGLSR